MWACTGRPHRSAGKCHYGSGVKRVTLAQHVCWHLIGSVYCLCQADWTGGLTALRLFPFAEAIISLLYKRSGMYGWGSEVVLPEQRSLLSVTDVRVMTERAETEPRLVGCEVLGFFCGKVLMCPSFETAEQLFGYDRGPIPNPPLGDTEANSIGCWGLI